MRSEFEKLPEVAIIFEGLHPTIIWFCESSNQYATSFLGFENKVVWLNGAWYAFQEQQKKLDAVKKTIVSLRNEFDLWSYDTKSFNVIEAQIENLEELLK